MADKRRIGHKGHQSRFYPQIRSLGRGILSVIDDDYEKWPSKHMTETETETETEAVDISDALTKFIRVVRVVTIATLTSTLNARLDGV
jgi:hypothetical protein